MQTSTPLCLSMSDFHPESWNPLVSRSMIIFFHFYRWCRLLKLFRESDFSLLLNLWSAKYVSLYYFLLFLFLFLHLTPCYRTFSLISPYLSLSLYIFFLLTLDHVVSFSPLSSPPLSSTSPYLHTHTLPLSHEVVCRHHINGPSIFHAWKYANDWQRSYHWCDKKKFCLSFFGIQ